MGKDFSQINLCSLEFVYIIMNLQFIEGAYPYFRPM